MTGGFRILSSCETREIRREPASRQFQGVILHVSIICLKVGESQCICEARTDVSPRIPIDRQIERRVSD